MYTPRTKFQATVAEVKHKGSHTVSRDVEAPLSPMSQLGITSKQYLHKLSSILLHAMVTASRCFVSTLAQRQYRRVCQAKVTYTPPYIDWYV